MENKKYIKLYVINILLNKYIIEIFQITVNNFKAGNIN